MKESAPLGAGRVNRIESWLGSWLSIVDDLLFWMPPITHKYDDVRTATIRLDVYQSILKSQLITILRQLSDTEYIESVLPNKYGTTADYITELTGLKMIVDAECKNYLR